MRRRDFFGIMVVGATGWPLMIRAQQRLPVVGILSATAPGTDGVSIFKRSLNEMGYADGVNSGLFVGTRNLYGPRFNSNNIVPLCTAAAC